MNLIKNNSNSKQSFNIGAKLSGIIFLIFTFIHPANGQEQKSVQQQDTSIKRSRFYDPELFLVKPALIIPHSYGDTQVNFSDFLHQSLTVPMPPFSWTYKTKIDLQSAWKQELTKQEEYRTLRTILGSIEMGGVAYLAYLHLKKYGLK
ncbi:MAG: hypothetical protein ABR936_01155 [Bacteroidota bacterium]|jgi:hypothetical protein